MDDASIRAILDGTHQGLQDRTDYARAQRELRAAEEKMETAAVELAAVDGDNDQRFAWLSRERRDRRGELARRAAALMDATIREFPDSKDTVGQAYARVLSDLLVGRVADTRMLWTAVWCARHQAQPEGVRTPTGSVTES